jgi:RimJ/RimL family protein N-acetyltransferase
MAWTITKDLEEYLAEAGDFLRADPAGNTVPLSVAETLRAQGTDVYGNADAVFGWWRPDAGEVGGIFLHTRPYPILLSAMPERAARELADVLAGDQGSLPGVNADQVVAQAFAAAWERRTGTAGEVRMRQRLYRLERLQAPKPLPPGTPRIATASDHSLVLAWLEAFQQESQGPGGVNALLVDDKIGYGGITLWEIDSVPMSLAGRTRVVADMARIAPVYTPPEHRRQGYGAAVTAAVTRSALGAGARDVVLFTDLANPTSNSIYQRLGYRPVIDRLMLAFPAPSGS